MVKLVTAGVLTLLAFGTLLFPAQARRLAGLRPLEAPGIQDLDELRQLQEMEAGSFFDERYRMEITVPRAMTVDTFLRLNNIRLPHVRQQIQRNGEPLPGDALLEAGETFTITLIPPQEL